MPSDFIPPTYWDSVKQRLAEIGQMPGNAIRGQMGQIAQGAVMNPNARPSTPAEAMPGNVDPAQRQALIEAIMQRQGSGQMPGMPQPPQQTGQPIDQRQLLLQEAARRGIQVPPDSPLLQGQGQGMGGQQTPDNPAGIQF